MRLGTWLKITKAKRRDFAEKIGVSAPTVTRIERGTQNISLDVVDKVVSGTEGAVTANDLHAAFVKARARAA